VFDPTTLTGFHTWLSLVAIGTGFVVLAGLLLRGEAPRGWTDGYLGNAIATSTTGFAFPFNGVLPSHIVGAVSLVVLGLVVVARARRGWGWVQAGGMVVGLYLLMFVAVAQLFMKVPAINALAPTLSEPPFAIAQGVLLLVFAWLTVLAVRRFRAAA
jgi:hypothetical protein